MMIDKNKGLLEQIRDDPKPETSLNEELSKPNLRKPNSDVIYGGFEFIKKLCEKNPKIFGNWKF